MPQTRIAIFALLALCVSARAQEPVPTLKAGDPAPALSAGKFIKGQPVSNFEKGRIYVVEFWATWCGPCRQSIPHLTQLQQKYKDVIFIGQDCMEQDQSVVAPFVEQMGNQMEYRVALDDVSGGGNGKMVSTWMQAAGQTGIPCAFIVDRESKIAWIGHPMTMDKPLDEIVSGTYDLKKAGEQEQRMKNAQRRLEAAQQSGDQAELFKVIDQVSAEMPEVAGPMAMSKFGILIRQKEYDPAYVEATKAGELLKDNPEALNEIAWMIVDAPGIEKRDLDVALKLASRAAEVTKNQRGDILDTLARVHFEKGDIDKAIAIQTEAVSRMQEGPLRQQLQATLDKYKSKKGS